MFHEGLKRPRRNASFRMPTFFSADLLMQKHRSTGMLGIQHCLVLKDPVCSSLNTFWWSQRTHSFTQRKQKSSEELSFLLSYPTRWENNPCNPAPSQTVIIPVWDAPLLCGIFSLGGRVQPRTPHVDRSTETEQQRMNSESAGGVLLRFLVFMEDESVDSRLLWNLPPGRPASPPHHRNVLVNPVWRLHLFDKLLSCRVALWEM